MSKFICWYPGHLPVEDVVYFSDYILWPASQRTPYRLCTACAQRLKDDPGHEVKGVVIYEK